MLCSLNAQLNAQGVVKIDNIKWVNTNAARCWFVGLLFAVCADLYRLRNNLQRLSILSKASTINGAGGKPALKTDEDALKKEVATLQKYSLINCFESLFNSREQQKIMLEVIQDALDLIIPGSILEYINVSQGVVGLVGTITSIIGWSAAWPR